MRPLHALPIPARRLCRLALTVGIVLACARAQQNTPGRLVGADNRGTRHEQLRVVASSKVFNQVNRNDARASLKVCFDMVGQQRGYLVDSTVDIVDSVNEMRDRLQIGRAHV